MFDWQKSFGCVYSFNEGTGDLYLKNIERKPTMNWIASWTIIMLIQCVHILTFVFFIYTLILSFDPHETHVIFSWCWHEFTL